MKTLFLFLLLFFTCFASAQSVINAEVRKVEGLVLYRFFPNGNKTYCSLKTKILIDSNFYDFIPHNDANASIIRKNPILTEKLGDADTYSKNDIISHMCVFRPNDERLKNVNCDSVIRVYSRYNLYDSLLFNPNLEELMHLTHKSNSIYTKHSEDTVFIALQIAGTVIQYNHININEEENYTNDTLNQPTLTNTYSNVCSSDQYNSTILILNTVEKVESIDETTKRKLELQDANIESLKIFLHE